MSLVWAAVSKAEPAALAPVIAAALTAGKAAEAALVSMLALLAPLSLVLAAAVSKAEPAAIAVIAPVIAAAFTTRKPAAPAFLMPLVSMSFLLSEWAKTDANSSVRVSKREKYFIFFSLFYIIIANQV